MSVLAGLVALLKAIPAIRDIFEKMVGLSLEYDRKKNEADAASRKAAKDAAVDHALDGMPIDTLTPEQLGTAHREAGFPISSGSSAGVGPRQPENDQRTGV